MQSKADSDENGDSETVAQKQKHWTSSQKQKHSVHVL